MYYFILAWTATVIAIGSYAVGVTATKTKYENKIVALENTIETGEHCINMCVELWDDWNC